MPGMKKGELFVADINTQLLLKNRNVTANFKVDTSSNLVTTITLNEPAPGVKAILTFKVPDQSSSKADFLKWKIKQNVPDAEDVCAFSCKIHHCLLDKLIVEAITSLKEPGGSDKAVITSYIKRKLNWDAPNLKKYVGRKLKPLVENGTLIKRREEIGKQIRSHQKYTHTSGSKSFARVSHEIEVATGKAPGHIHLYGVTHMRNGRKFMNAESEQLYVKAKQKMDEKMKEKERSEEELAALEDSTFVKVMGEDYPGHVRGMGKGPTPSSYYASTSRSHAAHVKSIKVQQLQSEVQEMRREMKEKDDRVENLEKQVKEKDDRLEKLEEQVALLLQKVKKKSKQKRMFHVDK